MGFSLLWREHDSDLLKVSLSAAIKNDAQKCTEITLTGKATKTMRESEPSRTQRQSEMKPGHKTKQTKRASAAVARLGNTLWAHSEKKIFIYLCLKHL